MENENEAYQHQTPEKRRARRNEKSPLMPMLEKQVSIMNSYGNNLKDTELSPPILEKIDTRQKSCENSPPRKLSMDVDSVQAGRQMSNVESVESDRNSTNASPIVTSRSSMAPKKKFLERLSGGMKNDVATKAESASSARSASMDSESAENSSTDCSESSEKLKQKFRFQTYIDKIIESPIIRQTLQKGKLAGDRTAGLYMSEEDIMEDGAKIRLDIQDQLNQLLVRGSISPVLSEEEKKEGEEEEGDKENKISMRDIMDRVVKQKTIDIILCDESFKEEAMRNLSRSSSPEYMHNGSGSSEGGGSSTCASPPAMVSMIRRYDNHSGQLTSPKTPMEVSTVSQPEQFHNLVQRAPEKFFYGAHSQRPGAENLTMDDHSRVRFSEHSIQLEQGYRSEAMPNNSIPRTSAQTMMVSPSGGQIQNHVGSPPIQPPSVAGGPTSMPLVRQMLARTLQGHAKPSQGDGASVAGHPPSHPGRRRRYGPRYPPSAARPPPHLMGTLGQNGLVPPGFMPYAAYPGVPPPLLRMPMPVGIPMHHARHPSVPMIPSRQSPPQPQEPRHEPRHEPTPSARRTLTPTPPSLASPPIDGALDLSTSVRKVYSPKVTTEPRRGISPQISPDTSSHDQPLDLSVRRDSRESPQMEDHHKSVSTRGPIQSLESSVHKYFVEVKQERMSPNGYGHSPGAQRLSPSGISTQRSHPTISQALAAPPRGPPQQQQLEQHAPPYPPPPLMYHNPRPPTPPTQHPQPKLIGNSAPLTSHKSASLTTAQARELSTRNTHHNSLLGDHPPDDILYLICNLCSLTYGSLYGFRRHFRNQHGCEPLPDHVSIQSISATRNAVDRVNKKHGEKSGTQGALASLNLLPSATAIDRYHYQHGENGQSWPEPSAQGDNQSSRSSERENPTPTTNIEEKIISEDANVLKCTECGERFLPGNWSLYKRHMKSHDRQEGGRLKCDKCDLTFHESHDLKEHMNSKHDAAEALFVCKLCDTVYPNSGSLNQHIQMVHAQRREGSPSVNHRCTYCSQTFSHLQEFVEHIEKHKARDLPFLSEQKTDETKNGPLIQDEGRHRPNTESHLHHHRTGPETADLVIGGQKVKNGGQSEVTGQLHHRNATSQSQGPDELNIHHDMHAVAYRATAENLRNSPSLGTQKSDEGRFYPHSPDGSVHDSSGELMIDLSDSRSKEEVMGSTTQDESAKRNSLDSKARQGTRDIERSESRHSPESTVDLNAHVSSTSNGKQNLKKISHF